MIGTIGDRVKHIMQHYSLTQREFASAIESNQACISSITQGKRPCGDTVTRKILAAFPAVSRAWLLSGEGEMLRPAAPPSTDDPMPRVPLIPIGAYAGSYSDTSPMGVDLSRCDRVLSPVPGADIAIDVSGDSMEPEFPNGCRVFARRINDQAFIAWRQVYILDTENGPYIKRILPTEGGVIAESLNPDYPAFKIPSESIRGLYRVLMMARGYAAS